MTIINIDEQLAELTQVREELVKSLEVVDYRIYLLKSYESITNCPMQITHVEFETSVQTIPSLGNGIVSPNSHIPSKGKEEEVTRSLIAHCKRHGSVRNLSRCQRRHPRTERDS